MMIQLFRIREAEISRVLLLFFSLLKVKDPLLTPGASFLFLRRASGPYSTIALSDAVIFLYKFSLEHACFGSSILQVIVLERC